MPSPINFLEQRQMAGLIITSVKLRNQTLSCWLSHPGTREPTITLQYWCFFLGWGKLVACCIIPGFPFCRLRGTMSVSGILNVLVQRIPAFEAIITVSQFVTRFHDQHY